jgi:hypothetical protein
MNNFCRTGAAYICIGWTEELEWYKRKKQYYCYKCNRPIYYNEHTRNWRHIKKKNDNWLIY